VLLLLLRVPGISGLATQLAKVWLRQARLVHHMAVSAYDGVIDGGASIGEFAALVRLAMPAVPLLCVEPHPESARVLRRRGFTVVEAALWSEAASLQLIQPVAAVTSASVVLEEQPDRRSFSVRAVRLDELPVAGRRLLVKLDLQGAELQALAGMGELWTRCAGLLLEVSYGASGTYETLRTMLHEKGFREAATFNELVEAGLPVEADKLWVPIRHADGQ
jgi:FkbM family methyltransferase